MHKRITDKLDEGYRAMAADQAREAEAMEWCASVVWAKADMLALEDAIKVHLALPK